MEERRIKTHLIITNTYEEYHVDWFGKIAETKPKIKNGKPIFVIIGSKSRMELNTVDIKHIEKCAKKMTYPKGRSAVTSDEARIFIKEEDGNEKLLGKVTHNHIKEFAPMYDKVGYR